MSAEAVARLQRLWERLSFAEVTRTIAREPEDVLTIEVLAGKGRVAYPS